VTASADATPPSDRWLAKAADYSPDVADCLRALNIATDEQYLIQRQLISETIRDQLDRLRYSLLSDDVAADDPFSLARVVPLARASMPLVELRLSTRCSKVLRRENVTTIAVLTQFTLDHALHHWKGFGRTSARELAACIRQSIDGGVAASDAGGISLAASVADELHHLRERDARILADRIGVTGAGRTLEAIARDHGVTRQRIEQIVSRWLKTTENRPWRRELSRRLKTALTNRDEPLYLDLLDNEDSWFAGWPEPLNLGNAIELFTASEVRVISVAGLYVVTHLEQQTWDRLPSRTLAYLKSLGPSLSESETRLAIEGFAEAHGARGLGELLYFAIRQRLQFTTQGGETTLSSIGGGLIHHVKAVLDAAETPLHYKDIAAICSERMGREISPAYVGNFLPAAGAKYCGRGRWGQSRHFGLSDANRSALIRAVEALMSRQPERQWHVDELLAEISTRLTAPSPLDKYTINFALESSKLVVSKGRFVWAFTSHSDRARIDVGDACEQLVRERGRPMTRAELVAALSKLRGLGQFLNITAKNQLLRTSPGTWGLLERDFGLTSQQAADLVERLHAILAEATRPLDKSGLRGFLEREHANRLTIYMLLSLAQRDARFWVQRGHRLGLSSWRTSEPEGDAP
jgi:hypothetical protein